ncbi:MAG: DUF4388 domain-containing protein [Desulfuromonadales bacterium]
MASTFIDNQGRLMLPPALVREIGNRPLDLVSRSDRHLLLTAEGGEGTVILAGRLGEIPVVDLLSFCNMFRKTGVLRFEFLGGSKNLYFQQGEIVSATSTFVEEDIGEVLLGMGMVARDVLQKARSFNAGAKLGGLLVENGVLEAKDLWLATRQQAEAIVFHLFSFSEGSFSFLHRSLQEEEVLRLSMGTQNLIMEGLRRVDEQALFMRRLRSLDAIPVVTEKVASGLDAAPQEILKIICEERFSVRDVVRRSGLGEFDGLRHLHGLVEKGLVAIEEAPVVAVEGKPGEILTVFNGVLAALYRRVQEKVPAFRQETEIFLRDLPQPYSYVFRDIHLKEDGTIDGGRILANLAGLQEVDKRKLLADALNELVYMECHAARKELASAESTELIQRVQKVSRRVKALIGSTE